MYVKLGHVNRSMLLVATASFQVNGMLPSQVESDSRDYFQVTLTSHYPEVVIRICMLN